MHFMKCRSLLAGLVLAAAVVGPATALPVQYEGTLLGASEVPPVATPGFGDALVTVDVAANTMRVQTTFGGLLSDVFAAHIHCCTPPGANVGVATVLPTFTGFPSGVTFGTYDHTFDMTLSSSYNPAFITAHGGTAASAFVDLVAGLDAGDAYLNIHTTSFRGGEIRALLAPLAVPEPPTYAMLVAGLGALMWVARRRRSA